MDAYHAEKGVATKSGLDRIAKSPAKYHAWMTGQIDDKDTDAMKDGRRLHGAVLEPEKFETEYFRIVKPKFSGKGARARAAEWALEHPEYDSEFNLGEKRDYYLRLAERVRNHPEARIILAQGEAEKEFRRELETVNGDKVTSKCRYDWIDGDLGADLKFVREDCAMPDKFWWHVRDFRYHVQEAFYCKIHPVDHWFFIVIEKTVPYDMSIFKLPLNLVLEGDRLVDENLQTFADCFRTDTWPGYPTKWIELEDPRRKKS